MHTIKTVVRREGESLICVVEAYCKSNIKTVEDLFKAINKSVTEWIENSEEGLDWFVNITSEDANIGDLSSYMDGGFSSPLDDTIDKHPKDDIENYLIKNGIIALFMKTFGNEKENNWSYDTHIFDEERTEKVIEESTQYN